MLRNRIKLQRDYIMKNRVYHEYVPADHTFVICAYKESKYLEEMIISLLNQTVKSNIIIATSTPNNYIENLAHKYSLEVFINRGESSIADDWNYGYTSAKTPIVTIAHQDDIYDEDYCEKILEVINQAQMPLIAFSDYGEIRRGEKVLRNKLLLIKRMLLFPLRFKHLHKSKFIRRRILSFGSAICCPSVTYIKPNLPDKVFQRGYLSDVDWQAWEKLSRLRGEFVYYSKPLMYHRIHIDSATTEIIANRNRSKEDFEMLCKFWPKSVAYLLESIYCKGEKSNNLD